MIIVMSLWRNDSARRLEARAAHLLKKASAAHDVRWLWVVGDSSDETEARLRSLATASVTVFRFDSGIRGDDVQSARRRGAWTASRMFAKVRASDDFACLHESDLVSPNDVLDRLLANQMPVAGWPMIRLNGHAQFYDVWAYRTLTGRHFAANQVAGRTPLEVGSFGSCWIAPAALVRNRVIGEDCVVDLCRQWRHENVRLWVDPTIAIEQPADLWEAR